MTFAHILTVLRRRWLTIVAGMVLGALVALILSFLLPTKYSATTSLVVSPVSTNPFADREEEVNIKTEREILSSREVAERASQVLGVELAPDSYLLSQVDVASPLGSQVLQVTVQADSPEQAVAAADALSTAYLDFRREGVDETAGRYLEKLDAQLADLQEDNSSAALIATLQQQRLNAMLLTPEPGRIIGKASMPTHPAGPGRTITLAGGLAAGALLGVCGAILYERFDRRVRSADRLSVAIGKVRLVSGAAADEDFWNTLADEMLYEVKDLEIASPLRVLLPEASAAVNDENEDRLLDAVAVALGESVAEPDAKDGEDVVASTQRCSRARIARASHNSDLAVLLTGPEDELADITAAATSLRKAELPFVIGFLDEPRVATEHSHTATSDDTQ